MTLAAPITCPNTGLQLLVLLHQVGVEGDARLLCRSHELLQRDGRFDLDARTVAAGDEGDEEDVSAISLHLKAFFLSVDLKNCTV